MKMKRTLLVMFILLMTATAGGQGQIEGTPGVFLPNQSFEFKPVPEGTEVQHEFVLENTGSAPLHIKNVRTG